MKFSLKLLLWTVIVMAIGLGCTGFYYVNYVFDTALQRELNQALDENSILQFAFETAALNAPAKYDVLPDQTITQIALSLESGGPNSVRMLRICDQQRLVLYASEGFVIDGSLLGMTDEGTKTYRIIRQQGKYYIHTGVAVKILDRTLHLETMKDVTDVFRDRALGFSVYRRVTVIMLILGTIVMYLISSFLTRPIRLLTRATKRMTAGDYDYRAKQVSDDELGQLTNNFNSMANALEENIGKLEDELQAREDFVAAFAHELKTPLTAIIGYADMLRSCVMDDEKRFTSANYIYTEGKRLEAMSFRLLDIIVTRRGDIEFQMVPAKTLIYNLYDMYATDRSMDIRFSYDEAVVRAEVNLIKSVLINLLDNACKASEPGGLIEVTGHALSYGYSFSVKDHGMGIPKEEQYKITQAFYMVDKSRSRSRNGAGLGLALCTEILYLHNSRLIIESELGEGSCISFILPNSEAEGELHHEKNVY